MSYTGTFNNVHLILRLMNARLQGSLLVVLLLVSASLMGCYSFTGASVPPHLKTLQIPLAEDMSGFGNAQFRETFTQGLIRNFRGDNSFTLVQERSDALLTVTITGIQDATATVQPGELERERKVTVNVKVLYEDLVKKRPMWEGGKTFSQFQIYEIAAGLQGRDAAIVKVLDNLSNDIFLAVISGW